MLSRVHVAKRCCKSCESGVPGIDTELCTALAMDAAE